MYPHKVVEILKRIEIPHPHWKLETWATYSLPDNTLKVELHFTGPNSAEPSNAGEVVHQQVMDCDHMREEEDVVRWVFEHWMSAWRHEAMEWIRFDGKLIKDPHKKDDF